MKYITKVDEDHKGFKAVILTSAGIGKQYTETIYRDWETDRKSTRLNSSHITRDRMPSSA